MDRDLIYPGQLGLVDNLLNTFKSAMIGIGAISEAVLGQTTQVYGLSAAALSNTDVPGSAFAISVGRGAIFAYEQTDTNAYGVLGTDSTSIVKAGINLTATDVGITNAAPSQAGYSINYLVSAQFQETDTNQVSLPFYNAGGTPNLQIENGTRTQRAVFQVTAGTAAATGSQTTPSAPAGCVPLYVVTVTNGQTAVAGGNIATAPGAPFITTLSALAASVNNASGALAAEVATRTAQAGNMKELVNVFSNTTMAQAQQGSLVEINASSTVTTTLPTPVGQDGAFFRIYNASAYAQTIITAAANFTGPGGNLTASITLPSGQMIEVASDHNSWVVSAIPAPATYYLGNQTSPITPVVANTTYTIAGVTVTFPTHSRSGAFRVRGRMVQAGNATSASSQIQNFISSLSDGTSTFSKGASWLVYGTGINSWGNTDYFESPGTYAPGSTETFTMSVATLGGNTTWTISGCFLELFAVEA